jgi:CDP-6-deoxy-D-xylo-4-hexulose-3-dehydrase
MVLKKLITKNSMKPWRLNDSNFTFLDRIKICKFFLNPKNFWTMNKQVSLFEEKMANYIGVKYAVFVSSGSTANTILAMFLRDKACNKNKIIFPSTTWTTSVAPFIREGFDPVFLDINLNDFSIDLNILESYLQDNHKNVACVFLTSLIGFSPDIDIIKNIQKKFDVKIMMDNCENTFGEFDEKNISSFFTSTTSTYFGHQIQSVEGGFIFTNCEQERDYFLMARNHGMTRSLKNPQNVQNKNVDSQFDFYQLGSNFRNTDINAFIGLLDFNRLGKLKLKRENLFSYFSSNVNNFKLKMKNGKSTHSPFCIPIICNSEKQKTKIIDFCRENNIETRPIISGNLLRQTCYNKYGNPKDYPNSDFIHNNGFYVGLHYNVNIKQVKKLVNFINKNQ